MVGVLKLNFSFLIIPVFSIANRLIKYTGFSNANQLLYDLGLVDLQDNSNKDQYSSDSDAFDTENDRILDDEYE